MDKIEKHQQQPGFFKEVVRRSGVNIGLCWHCKCCSGGCPFAESMDYLPNQALRMVQLDLKEEVLKSSCIWICVGCHTCSVECPQAIDMSAVMDTLRQMAMEEGFPLGQPNILNFHKEVVNSIYRHGRTHKLEIMMRYKLGRREFFSDMDVGLSMLSKRKLDLMPSRMEQPAKIRKLFREDTEDVP